MNRPTGRIWSKEAFNFLGLGQEVFEISRVLSGRIRRFQISRAGSGRVAPRVGSGGFQLFSAGRGVRIPTGLVGSDQKVLNLTARPDPREVT